MPATDSRSNGPKQLRLMGPHAGASLSIGSLRFDRGVTRSMSAFDAEVNAAVIRAISQDAGATGDATDDAAADWHSRYAVEIIDAGLPQTEGDHVA